MKSLASRIVRRVRYGRPIVIVSGLPRSGTSMAMKMLEAGGVPIVTDGVRLPDSSNPKGYYEFEPVKDIHKQADMEWLGQAKGRAVKVVSFLLTWLPEHYNYKVIFMQRDLGEVIASETTMLQQRGVTPEPTANAAHTAAVYEHHLQKVARFLNGRACFSTLQVHYRDALERPADEARRISAFLGGGLDVEAMARVADPALYRNRNKTS